MIKIEQLMNVTTKAVEEMNFLLPQLSKNAKPLSYASLLDVIKDPATTLLVVKDGAKIVGMGTLLVFHNPVGKWASLQDIVIDEAYRGQGLGEKLSKHMIELARGHKVGGIELTSKPDRIVAHKLYEKLGFEKKETNVYRLRL